MSTSSIGRLWPKMIFGLKVSVLFFRLGVSFPGNAIINLAHMLTDLSLPPFYVFIGSSYGKKKSEANEAKTILRLSEQLMGGDGWGLGTELDEAQQNTCPIFKFEFCRRRETLDSAKSRLPPKVDFKRLHF